MRKTLIGLVIVAAVVATPSADAAKPVGGPKASSYTARNLGVLPGDTYSHGFGVSDAGSVVGVSGDGRTTRAFYWDRIDGAMYQLTTSDAEGMANAIAGRQRGSEYAVGWEYRPGKPGQAVIWIAPPTSSAVILDDEPSIFSEARGVNDLGVAVGTRGGFAAIWTPRGDQTYARTEFVLSSNEYATAIDINNQGIVVGVSDPDTTVPSNERAFVRLVDSGGTVHELPPAEGDVYSLAQAVSDVVTNAVGEFVYVAGSTIGGDGVEHAVRWTVDVATGAVVETKRLDKEWAAGVNTAGDVACTNGTSARQSATLWRNGTYVALKPPKGATGAASFGLARTASAPTYVVGSANMSGNRAVIWEVR